MPIKGEFIVERFNAILCDLKVKRKLLVAGLAIFVCVAFFLLLDLRDAQTAYNDAFNHYYELGLLQSNLTNEKAYVDSKEGLEYYARSYGMMKRGETKYSR